MSKYRYQDKNNILWGNKLKYLKSPYCGLVVPCGDTEICKHDLLLDGAKPLSEPILTYH